MIADTAVKFDLPAFVAALTGLLTALGVVVAQLAKLRGSVAKVHQEVVDVKTTVNGGPSVPEPVPPPP